MLERVGQPPDGLAGALHGTLIGFALGKVTLGFGVHCSFPPWNTRGLVPRN